MKAEGKGKRKEAPEGAGMGVSFGGGSRLCGLPAKVQPHGLFGPGRRYVETSGDVIYVGFIGKGREVSIYIFVQKKLRRASAVVRCK
jgi:hypothetical protein